MAWRRPGDKPLSEIVVVSLLTHICVTLPQWVKVCEIKGQKMLSKFTFGRAVCQVGKTSVHWGLPVEGSHGSWWEIGGTIRILELTIMLKQGCIFTCDTSIMHVFFFISSESVRPSGWTRGESCVQILVIGPGSDLGKNRSRVDLGVVLDRIRNLFGIRNLSVYYHNQVKTKCVPFCKNKFQVHFLHGKSSYFDSHFNHFFPRVQSTVNQHWFRWWLGDKQPSSHYLKQWWPSLLTHKCYSASMS